MHMFVYVQCYTFYTVVWSPFGVNVELSSLIKVSLNIDLWCGPWSIGHVISHEMVWLSNLETARAIGTHGSVRDLVSCMMLLWFSVWTNQRLPGWWPGTERPGMSKIVPKVVVPDRQHNKLTTEARELSPSWAAGPQRGVPTWQCQTTYRLYRSSQIISSKMMWTCLSGQPVPRTHWTSVGPGG